MEYFDIVDEDGIPTGKTVERTDAHRNGILHRTSHLWIFRKKDGILEVLLQKRSQNKDSFPGKLDISSAGHIPAGDDFIGSALRELSEELGLMAKPEDLIFCGRRRLEYTTEFHGQPFHDNQVTNVYRIWKDIEISDLILQASEIEDAQWIDFNQCYARVEAGDPAFCVALEELNILKHSFVKEQEI